MIRRRIRTATVVLVVAGLQLVPAAHAQLADGIYAGGSTNADVLFTLKVSGQAATATVFMNWICHGATTSVLRTVRVEASADGTFQGSATLRQSAWTFAVNLKGQVQGKQVTAGHYSVTVHQGTHRCKGVRGRLDLRLAEPLSISGGHSATPPRGWFAGGTVSDPYAAPEDRPIIFRSSGRYVWGNYEVAVPCPGQGTLPAFLNTTTKADRAAPRPWDWTTEPDHFTFPQRGLVIHYYDVVRGKWVPDGLVGSLRVRANYRLKGQVISCDTGWLHWEAAAVVQH